MTSDDPTPSTGEPEPIIESNPVEAAASERSPDMNKWTYLGLAAVPRDRATLIVDQSDGRHSYKPGESVQLSQAQHDHLAHEGHLFKEDIVQSPGG